MIENDWDVEQEYFMGPDYYNGIYYNETDYNETDYNINSIIKHKIIEEEIIYMNLDRLSKMGYNDENINEIISRLKEYVLGRIKAVTDALSNSDIKKIYSSKYSEDCVKFEMLNGILPKLVRNYRVVTFDKANNLDSYINEIMHLYSSSDLSLKSEKSFSETVKFLGVYINTKEVFEKKLQSYRMQCLKSSFQYIDNINMGTQLRQAKIYLRFGDYYNNIINKCKQKLINFVSSEDFAKGYYVNNDEILENMLNEFDNELNTEIESLASTVDYMDQRMLRLKKIFLKRSTIEERAIYNALSVMNDKNAFDNLYNKLYTILIDHKNDEDALKEINKTSRTISAITKKVDKKFNTSTKYMNDNNLTVALKIKNYIYALLGRIACEQNNSFDPKVISQLSFVNFEEDIKLINEGVNGNNVIPTGNVYIPRLDSKYFNRRFSYPLVELTFNSENIKINELTKQGKIDGDPYINYDTFLNQYMSIDTYIKNARYVGKNFEVNGSHNENSQDFSDSKLLYNYRDILLIEKCGEYEIVSHETITNAGYDIPEPIEVKKDRVSFVETYKKLVLLKTAFFAEHYRDKESEETHKEYIMNL